MNISFFLGAVVGQCSSVSGVRWAGPGSRLQVGFGASSPLRMSVLGHVPLIANCWRGQREQKLFWLPECSAQRMGTMPLLPTFLWPKTVTWQHPTSVSGKLCPEPLHQETGKVRYHGEGCVTVASEGLENVGDADSTSCVKV